MKPTAMEPFGHSWRCHVCRASIVIQASFFGDATCSKCGSLLWPRPPRDQKAVRSRNRLSHAGAKFGIDRENRSWKIQFSHVEMEEITTEQLKQIGTITELYLYDCRISKYSLSILSELRTLEVLELGCTNITENSLALVNRLTQLELLALDETNITDESLGQLYQLSNLWSLDLDQTKIQGTNLAQLPFIGQLECLSLSQTNIDDQALDQLHFATKLEELWVENTKVTARGLRRIKKRLPNCIIHSS